MRNFSGMTLAVLALIGSAVALWFAVWLFWIVLVFCAICGVVVALVRSIKTHYRVSVFAERRKLGVEAVERLRSTIVQYEKNDVLLDWATYSGIMREMEVALDNARFVAADVEAWLVMICEYNHRRCMPLEGLQLADVAARVDEVNTNLVRCFRWLRKELSGPRPVMLDRSWYSLELFFPDYDRLYGNDFPPALTRRPVKLLPVQRYEGAETLHDARVSRGSATRKVAAGESDVDNPVADMAAWREKLRAQA